MKKRVILILLIFVVGSYITIFQTSFVKAQENIEEKREQADELYQQGGSLFNDKNYTEAKAKFTQAKSIYEEIGDTEKVEICNQFISKTYKGINGDTYFSQAEEKEEAGYFEGAIKDYESAKGFYSEIDQEKYELCKQKIEEIQKTFVIEGLTFPDRNLENAVLQDLRKNFVRKEDLIYVSGLDLSYGYINNIENIGRYFPNLQYLDLSNNNISDISPLLALSDLEELDLSNNDISDISPLLALTDLEELDLSNNDISDISPVSSLINLVELNLSNNDISDISPLIANPNLQTGTKVDISNNPLSSKSVELYIPILEGKGIELTWEPIKKISTTISFLKSKSFIYILVLVAIIISILAIFRITKKKSRKEVKKGKITEERPKEVKIHKEKRVESSELKKLLKERNELKSILNGLKYHKERLIAEKMSEEEYNKLYKQAIEKLKTIEELISLIEEK